MAGTKIKKQWPRLVRILAAASFIVAFCIAFFSGIGGLFQVQFGPALMRSLSTFSLGALSAVLVIALATILFGRFYCAVFCPLGILQDLAGFLSGRKAKAVPNFLRTRYTIAALVYGLLIAGWSAGFLLLDPYSNFGRMLGAFSAGALALPVLVILLSVWKKRLFCTVVCPVGTLLGLLAKCGVFRLAIRENCVKCGKCAGSCPSGCIDIAAGKLDNERCVRCMNCVSVCPLGCIGFASPGEVPFDATRRAFLVQTGILAAGTAVGFVLGKAGAAHWRRRLSVLPPGAGDPDRFTARCTSCQLCTVNCPSKIIVPAPGGAGPVSLDLTRGACRFDCTRCSEVCPAGALPPLTLAEKRKTKIGQAVIDPGRCLVLLEDDPCGACADACPLQAIELDEETGLPRVAAARCIGCGVCRSVCRSKEKAIHIEGIEKQVRLNGV